MPGIPKTYFICLLLGLNLLVTPVNAQSDVDHEEVFLDFRYMQLISTSVVAYYKNDEFYIGVSDMFTRLLVFNAIDWERLSVEGYIGTSSGTFLLDLDANRYRYKTNTGVLTADDYILDQFDIYLSAPKFQEIFNMAFIVDMSTLSMRLVTDERLQIRVREERNNARTRAQGALGIQTFHPLQYDRSPKIFNGGFIDYNLNLSSQNFERGRTTLGLVTGTEILHGDVQANLSIQNNPTTGTSLSWGNVRWRYYIPRGFVRQMIAGDISPNGITFNQPLRGVSVTNQPLFSSRIFDEYAFSDTADPDSEVEVFINNRLFDYFYVDESGFYQISLPITYGINDIRIVTYSPDGRVTEVTERLNIPFYFVPSREFYYTIQSGRTQTSGFNPDPYYASVADLAYGINRSSTVRGKVEYVTGSGENDYSALVEYNQRFFAGVLGTFQYSPSRFESANMSFQSKKNGFFNIFGTNYHPSFQQVNNGINYRFGANLFFGLPIESLPIFIRTAAERADFVNLNSTTLDGSFNTRIKRVSLNFGGRSQYRESQTISITQFGYTAGLSYTTPRAIGLWKPLRGISMRANISSTQEPLNFNRMNINVGRSFWGSGQIQATYSYLFPTQTGNFLVTVNFDLSVARFNSSYRRSGSVNSFNQSVRGSMGYFHKDRIVYFDNRGQVGRSALVINNFIDSDGDGKLSDGDDIMPYANAMRVTGSGSRTFTRKNRTLITQLRQYDRVNVEVNEASIQDPSLVALNRRFSVITDPNQFKYIEVAFSRSGILEGSVQRSVGRGMEGVGGLNIRIHSLPPRVELPAESTAQFFRIQTALMSTLPRAIMAKLEAEAATGAIFELQYSDRYKLFRLFSREIEGRENAVALLEVIRQKTQYSDAFIIDEDSYDAQDIFYAVQIGAFRTLRSATIHAREARDKFNLNAVVHFDSLSRWYVIHTLEWSDWRTASQIRMDIREQTDYKDAFLVTRPPVDLKSYTFAVQIGVYTNASFADRVTDDLRRRTGMPFSTQWNPRIELYSVRLNGITTWEEALQIREQLRTEFGVAESLILSISQ
jgi:hypothetical protein